MKRYGEHSSNVWAGLFLPLWISNITAKALKHDDFKHTCKQDKKNLTKKKVLWKAISSRLKRCARFERWRKQEVGVYWCNSHRFYHLLMLLLLLLLKKCHSVVLVCLSWEIFHHLLSHTRGGKAIRNTCRTWCIVLCVCVWDLEAYLWCVRTSCYLVHGWGKTHILRFERNKNASTNTFHVLPRCTKFIRRYGMWVLFIFPSSNANKKKHRQKCKQTKKCNAVNRLGRCVSLEDVFTSNMRRRPTGKRDHVKENLWITASH